MTTMEQLTAGTRIRHLRWGTTGTVKVDPVPGEDPLVHVPWDGSFVDDEISEAGPVQPQDVEVIS